MLTVTSLGECQSRVPGPSSSHLSPLGKRDPWAGLCMQGADQQVLEHCAQRGCGDTPGRAGVVDLQLHGAAQRRHHLVEVVPQVGHWPWGEGAVMGRFPLELNNFLKPTPSSQSACSDCLLELFMMGPRACGMSCHSTPDFFTCTNSGGPEKGTHSELGQLRLHSHPFSVSRPAPIGCPSWGHCCSSTSWYPGAHSPS